MSFPFVGGLIRDTPDSRDILFVPRDRVFLSGKLPLSVNRSSLISQVSVYNQGTVGSCTGCAVSYAHYYEQHKLIDFSLSGSTFKPSALFLYYNTRALSNNEKIDSGASIRDTMRSLSRSGVCSESFHGDEPSQFTFRPNSAAYKEARLHQGLRYRRVPQTEIEMKVCLASEHCFVAGLELYPSFMSDEVASTGMVTLPSSGETSLGGHAIFVLGYDDSTHRFFCRNSWGTSWGITGGNGYFTIPYSYLTDPNLTGDIWSLRKMQFRQISNL